jgi:hypothetical protein
MHGHSNHVTTLSNRNHAVVFVVQFVTGVSFSDLVKYLVAVIMYLAPDLLIDGLIGPTKSMSHLSNSCNVTYGCKGIPSLLDGFPTLSHTSHA